MGKDSPSVSCKWEEWRAKVTFWDVYFLAGVGWLECISFMATAVTVITTTFIIKGGTNYWRIWG
jgi:hypothetical protein